MKESIRQQQAFEYYYMLGKDRSIAAVARQFGVTAPSVSVWARNHNWYARVEERDEKNMATIRAANDKQVIEQMEAYRKIISASVAEYIKGLKNNNVKIETVSDFARLVRLDMELCGYVAESLNKDREETASNDINITLTIGEDTNEC